MGEVVDWGFRLEMDSYTLKNKAIWQLSTAVDSRSSLDFSIVF